MRVKNNFVNTITIGNFNPAILTPDFLKKECGFNFRVSPKGRTTPVLSNLIYNNVSFLVHLERFQIIESNVAKFEKSKVVSYLDKYLSILSYTPLSASGVNFNTSVFEISGELVERYLMYDRKKLQEILKAEELIIDSQLRYKLEEDKNYRMWNVQFSTKSPNTIGRLNVRKENGTFVFNYNFEVRNLNEDRKRITILTKNYLTILNKYKNLLEKLIGE